ncbi:uncharacterized protein LOC115450679 [Manduca sexta]|uniref:Telomerase reverse transcriptase n=1 Tax=Manduca sexta TaxID=7130 RepID=A0A921ZPH4_MANSE|nr:uncharacterized protein LOC115450679 [Manduca sexta]KAG6461063.1 hypothetical protein O3G_MSEX012408 [Manduca sexta]
MFNEIICFSQYFVNKQNVRSYSCVLKSNLLKKEDAVLHKHLFEDDSLVTDLTPEFNNILLKLKNNLRLKSKNDFRDIFTCDKLKSELQFVNKKDVFTDAWKCLNEIIPKEFYGHNKNFKIFHQLIEIVIYSMKYQHFNLIRYIEKWNFCTYPWKNLPQITSKQILYKIIKWIIQYILSPVICINFYVTTCKMDADENKLYFFWKHQWQSFYDKKIASLILTKTILKYDPFSMTKKMKNNYSLCRRKEINMLKKDIPKLSIILKPNNDCRPIVQYKNKLQTNAEKYRIKERLFFLKILTGKTNKKIEYEFGTLYAKWIELNKPKVYFVKTDLSNAFGSIDTNRLMKILQERHLSCQKSEKNAYAKKKLAQQCRDMIAELRKPIFIRSGSTVFEWKKGLVQGYKYSPALSDLYYTHLDEIYFKEHLEPARHQIKLFIRVVDDYLYITDSLEDANNFLKALSNYKNVNYEKTIVNFDHPNIKYSEEITFLGYTYNTMNWHVSRANSVFVGQMCYKIAFTSALSDPYKFLENRIGQSGIQVTCHIFNLVYNTEEMMWRHVFTTFCLSANKFCTIYAIICNKESMRNCLQVYKNRVTVKLTNSIVDTLMRFKPADTKFIYCINHFRYLSWLALSLCAKKTLKCTDMVPHINVEMAKSNCIFGKWNDHASQISKSGEVLKPAVKEVCRRTDFRVIFKTFYCLPNGFECFDHRIK